MPFSELSFNHHFLTLIHSVFVLGSDILDLSGGAQSASINVQDLRQIAQDLRNKGQAQIQGSVIPNPSTSSLKPNTMSPLVDSRQYPSLVPHPGGSMTDNERPLPGQLLLRPLTISIPQPPTASLEEDPPPPALAFRWLVEISNAVEPLLDKMHGMAAVPNMPQALSIVPRFQTMLIYSRHCQAQLNGFYHVFLVKWLAMRQLSPVDQAKAMADFIMSAVYQVLIER